MYCLLYQVKLIPQALQPGLLAPILVSYQARVPFHPVECALRCVRCCPFDVYHCHNLTPFFLRFPRAPLNCAGTMIYSTLSSLLSSK
jgi:hypothetical protein